MVTFSILSETTARAQGDHVLDASPELADTVRLDAINAIADSGIFSDTYKYREQVYRGKTIARGTANKGKAALDFFPKSGRSTGARLTVSADCQFPLMVHAGIPYRFEYETKEGEIVVEYHILSMVPVFACKHLINQVGDLDLEAATGATVEAASTVEAMIARWKSEAASPELAVELYGMIHDQRPDTWTKPLPRLHVKTKMDLFLAAVGDLFFGKGSGGKSGRKSKPLTDLRRFRDEIPMIVDLLNR